MASPSGVPNQPHTVPGQQTPGTQHHTPQGAVDHRARTPGTGYQGGPTATSGKGPPANIGTGRVEPPTPPPTRTAGRVSLRV